MQLQSSHFLRATALCAVVVAWPVLSAGAQQNDQSINLKESTQTKIESLERENRRLTRQNAAMARSLAAANTAEDESAAALARIKTRLDALGRSVFGSSDQRLIDAVTTVESLSSSLQKLESASFDLSAKVQDYLSTSVAADPEKRALLEESIRNLDSAIGLRQKQLPDMVKGSLADAQVISIDTESGLLVLNIGSGNGATPGMTFSVRRGDLVLGQALIVSVRESVAGAFVESLNDPNNTVRLDDTLSLITDRR